MSRLRRIKLAAQHGRGWFCLLSMIITHSAFGQIATDGSLAGTTATTLSGPNYTIGTDLGQLQGGNLYHSFSQFNVNAGQSATFTAPSDVAAGVVNIMTRVTGGAGSNIDGVIRTTQMPNANFFLMNPNGVVFGPGAQLDVGGAFVVTTAHELRLADGRVFTANPGLTDATLTSAAPSAFGFLPADDGGAATPAAVTVQGIEGDTSQASNLQVTDGTTLSIVSGQIRVINGKLQAPSGQLTMVSVASAGVVEYNPTDPDAVPVVEPSAELGAISISARSDVNIDGDGAGRMTIRGHDMTVDNASVTGFKLESGNVDGGLIDINLTGDLMLSNRGAIQTLNRSIVTGKNIVVEAENIFISGPSFISVLAQSLGDAGHINVTARGTLDMKGFGSLLSDTAGPGNGGDIHVNAQAISMFGQDNPTQTMNLSITATVALNPGATGRGGNVNISTGSLEMANNAFIGATTLGPGDGGNLTINADHITIGDPDASIFSGLSVQTAFPVFPTLPSGGDAGRMTIETQTLEIINGGRLSTSTQGTGVGGFIDIEADHVLLNNMGFPFGTTIAAQASFSELIGFPTPATGPAGNIEIKARRLEVLNGAEITATTATTSPGGNITIRADEIFLDGQNERSFLTGITAQTQMLAPEDTGLGDGGNITILNTNGTRLTLDNAARISASTFSDGQGGNVVIHVDSLEMTRQGRVGSSARLNPRFTLEQVQQVTQLGDGGTILIEATNDVRLSEGAIIVTAADLSSAGQITVTSGTKIDVLSGSTISVAAENIGGKIKLTAPERVLVQDSTITGRAGEDGGRIEIDPQFVILDNSLIDGRAGGNPVQVIIDPNAIFLNSGSQILTPAIIAPPELDLSGSLVALPTSLLKAETKLLPSCTAQFDQQSSSFTVQGRGGVPLTPGGWLPSTGSQASPTTWSDPDNGANHESR